MNLRAFLYVHKISDTHTLNQYYLNDACYLKAEIY
jgi:hypothetical protein